MDKTFYSYALVTLTAKTSPVLIPSAVWLFGSGLIGVFGISKHKSEVS